MKFSLKQQSQLNAGLRFYVQKFYRYHFFLKIEAQTYQKEFTGTSVGLNLVLELRREREEKKQPRINLIILLFINMEAFSYLLEVFIEIHLKNNF